MLAGVAFRTWTRTELRIIEILAASCDTSKYFYYALVVYKFRKLQEVEEGTMLRDGFTCWSCLFYVYWGNNENGKVVGNILEGK